MPTLTVSINTPGGGTTSTTLNFSGADATRIFNALQPIIHPDFPNRPSTPITQNDVNDWLAQRIKSQFQQYVVRAEQTTPVPPDIT